MSYNVILKMRSSIILLLSILMLVSCSERDSKAQQESIKDAFSDLQEAFHNGDPEAIASRYVESSKFTKESNFNYASSLLKHFQESDIEIMHIRESGNFAAIVVVDVKTSSGTPMFARKVDGRYRFYRSINLWGNTNRVQHFGLSEKEMNIMLELQEWAVSKIS